ncbi:uncharacterized protein LOC111027259 [Myzus persicae]|uniref:uncharacterized protein LOC111027259 n=1 Tax=Myzus persicae TaxID=13164 RepID=UPI000B9381A9|nr:uncharacterized protein LOC111027259 [Myzus persicae]
MPQLSDLDKKVLSIIGNEYVEGTSCPDSWPEEQENNVQRTASGDSSIYLKEPVPLALVVDEENNNQENDIETLLDIEYETISCGFAEVDENATLAITSEIDKTLDQSNIRGSTSSKRPKIVKQNLRSQLQTARNTFNVIADKQTDSIKVIADSLLVIGKALDRMADNDIQRTENERKMLILYEKILEKK